MISLGQIPEDRDLGNRTYSAVIQERSFASIVDHYVARARFARMRALVLIS